MTATAQPKARSLRTRIASAAGWMVILRVAVRLLGIITTMVVARRLSQSELGTYGILLILDTGLQAVTSVGFDVAIVQMPRDPTPYLSTAWTATIIRGCTLYLLEFLVAPYWCDFFGV